MVSFSNQGDSWTVSIEGGKASRTLVYERDVNLYSISNAGGGSHGINIDIATDYPFDPFEYKTFTDQISEYQVAPDGH